MRQFCSSLLLMLLLVTAGWAQDDLEGAPVKNGEGWTYTDPYYGCSISYPATIKIKLVREVRKRLESAGKALSPNLREGMRFSLGAVEFKCDRIPPSLSCDVTWMDPRMGEVDDQQISDYVSRSMIGSQALITKPESPVEINGETFTRLDFDLTFKRDIARSGRCYYYYDPQARLLYQFVLDVCREHAQRDFGTLEPVLATLRLAKMKGPAPADAPGATGMAW